jgi:hypothetical protein
MSSSNYKDIIKKLSWLMKVTEKIKSKWSDRRLDKGVIYIFNLKNISIFCILAFISVIFMVTHSCVIVYAAQVDRYWSVPEADQNTPSTTDANGFIGIKFREDFKQLVYNVNVNNIENITGIFLYDGDNSNKKVTMILDLLEEAREVKVKDKYKEASIILASTHEVEGTVAVGGVTSDDLHGKLKGKSLKDLYDLVNNEGVYLVVTTKEHPLGEIFGSEFVPIDRFFPDMSDFNWS